MAHMAHMARIGAVLGVAALAGCGFGESRFNPFRTDAPDARREDAPIPGAALVDQVVSLEVAPTTGGAIVSAVGLPPTQGFWEAELVRRPSATPGTMLLEFRILPPLEPRRPGTQPSREVLAGGFYSTQDLSGIAAIAVQGATNARSVSRR